MKEIDEMHKMDKKTFDGGALHRNEMTQEIENHYHLNIINNQSKPNKNT